MPTRSEKLTGYAEHLLDAFLRLRATYSILDPLLFNRELTDRWKSGPAQQGRAILISALLYSCVLEASKLTLDQDPRTPSLEKLAAGLNDEAVLSQLREAYSVWNLHAHVDDPDVVAVLKAMDEKEEKERRAQFDDLVTQFRAGWTQLRESAALKSFTTLRDKVIAHNEVRHEDGRYGTFDVASLGLKFGDLRTIVVGLEPIVDASNLIFRASSFAFKESADQLRTAAEHFWSIARDG